MKTASAPEETRENAARESRRPPLPAIEEEILHAIRSVRYGSVEIVIQDSKVVQIERKEKFRFTRP